MACFFHYLNDWDLSIPSFSIENGVTFYLIKVRIGEICWSVKHRYKDFVELNNILSTDHGFSKDLLPPKKYFGNQDEVFMENRRRQLEEYLRRTFSLLKAPMPRLLVKFLKVDCFDIFYILETIPMSLDPNSYSKDPLLKGQIVPTLSLLQVHALWRCLKLPRPSTEVYSLTVDVSDVLEVCGSVEGLCVMGAGEYLADSNLDSLSLDFDLSVFKSLKHLTLRYLPLNLLCDASDLRRNVCTISVNYCTLKSTGDLIFCDQLHKDSHSGVSDTTWSKLTAADLSFNNIDTFGDSFSFVPRLKRLDLRNNSLNDFSGLCHLKELQYLNASNNRLSDLISARDNLRNLNYLDLSGNKISSLEGLEALTKLTGVDLSFNCIDTFDQLHFVSKLSLLSYVVLTGNPLSKVVDYRIKVLLEFGEGYKRLQIDHEETTQKELDRVAVLLALKHAEKQKLTNR